MEAIKTILFLLAGAFLAASGVLVIVGRADGEFEYEGMIRINHPYPSTFEFVTNPAKRKLWVPGVKDSAKIGTGQMDTAGTRFRESVTVDGVTTERIYEVKAFTYGQKFVITTSDPDCDWEVTYTFGAHQTGRKTRLGFTLRAQYDHWFDKLIEPIRGAGLKKLVRGDVEHLKFLLETTDLGD